LFIKRTNANWVNPTNCIGSLDWFGLKIIWEGYIGEEDNLAAI
jgi:hypothetical protein